MLKVVPAEKDWIFKAPLHAVFHLQRAEVLYRNVDPRVWTYLNHSKLWPGMRLRLHSERRRLDRWSELLRTKPS